MSEPIDPHTFDEFDEFDEDAVRLDQAIRRQLGASISSPHAAPIVLDELRRPLRRARAVQRSQLVASAAAAVALVAGLSHLAFSTPSETVLIAASPTTVAEMAPTIGGGDEPITTFDVSTEPPLLGSLGDDPANASPAATHANGAAGSPSTSSASATSIGTNPPSTPAPIVTTTPAPGSTSSGTSTSASTSTTAVPKTTTTTAETSGTSTISSSCGTITATASGSTITLTGTQPNPGFSVQVGNDGPEELEVSMSGSSGTCTITAKASRGQISSEVDVEPSADDGEHDD